LRAFFGPFETVSGTFAPALSFFPAFLPWLRTRPFFFFEVLDLTLPVLQPAF